MPQQTTALAKACARDATSVVVELDDAIAMLRVVLLAMKAEPQHLTEFDWDGLCGTIGLAKDNIQDARDKALDIVAEAEQHG